MGRSILVLENTNTVKILVINPTNKEAIIPRQKKLANISLLTSSVNAIGMASEEEGKEPELVTSAPGIDKAVTVGNDGWLATMKRRSDEDTEVKEKEEQAFKQQLRERIDPDLDEKKKEQM